VSEKTAEWLPRKNQISGCLAPLRAGKIAPENAGIATERGETKNMQRAIEELRLAYTYKTNIIAGETLPDPLKDDSFRLFVNDDGFVKAVTDMQK